MDKQKVNIKDIDCQGRNAILHGAETKEKKVYRGGGKPPVNLFQSVHVKYFIFVLRELNYVYT